MPKPCANSATAERLTESGQFGETEDLLVRIGAGEYLDQMFSGIPMSQGEMVRPTGSLGMTAKEVAEFRTEAVETLIAEGNTPENPGRPRDPYARRQRRRHRRRVRPRRGHGGDPLRDAPLRQGRGRRPRP